MRQLDAPVAVPTSDTKGEGLIIALAGPAAVPFALVRFVGVRRRLPGYYGDGNRPGDRGGGVLPVLGG